MDRRVLRLKELTELRVDVDATQSLTVSLKNGEAEVFGAELGLGERLSITGKRLSVHLSHPIIFSYGVIRYEAQDTPMRYYINLHHFIDTKRNQAKEDGSSGPRVIMVGESDSGKSTLCQILANYGVRMGWSPTYIDLDIGQGSISPPGTIGATPVQLPITIDDGYPLEVPLVYFYGHNSGDRNPELYKLMVENMANVLEKRVNLNPSVDYAGSIINTMGWIDGQGYDLLLHSILSLKADIVLVLGNKNAQRRLISDLDRKQHSFTLAPKLLVLGANLESTPVVLLLPKSSGVKTRSRKMRATARVDRIRNYFYGVRKNLMPYLQTCPSTDLKVFRIGPSSPGDHCDWFRITQIRVSNEIFNCFIAVSHARNYDELPYTSVAGFIYIQSVNVNEEGEGTVKFLAPCPGPLPGNLLLLGSIEILNL